MVSAKQLAILSLASLSFAADAPITTDSTGEDSLVADFNWSKKSSISGSVQFVPANNGSVLVNVNIAGLPSVGGPFPYHIHQKPVPADGNCTGTLLHLNPYHGAPNATSNAGQEVGDLASKHGKMEGPSYQASYVDNYISLDSADPAYIGGLSVVIHFLNNTRITCANLTIDEGVSSSTTVSGSKTSTIVKPSGGASNSSDSGSGSKNTSSHSSSNFAASVGATGFAAGIAAIGLGLLV